jgi:hypothetical protein
VKAINVKGGSKYSRKVLDELAELAKRYGAGRRSMDQVIRVG